MSDCPYNECDGSGWVEEWKDDEVYSQKCLCNLDDHDMDRTED